MNPVFALAMAALWLPLMCVLSSRLESESTRPEHRQALERRVTRPSALVIPDVAALLLLVGAWFALRGDDELWGMWLAAGLLVVVNFVLALGHGPTPGCSRSPSPSSWWPSGSW